MNKKAPAAKTTGASSTALSNDLHLRELLKVLTAYKQGDFTSRMSTEYTGLAGKVADTLNDIITYNQRVAEDLVELNQMISKKGSVTERLSLDRMGGSWDEKRRSINELLEHLTAPTVEIQRVIEAVVKGDLSQKITIQATGEVLVLTNTINKMVDQLSIFAAEVTRVAREVGTEGKLGGQAYMGERTGIWKEMTDNVNTMATNLTNQVRDIALVTSAVAAGDLSQKITIQTTGEVLVLTNTINKMVDQLSIFAAEVTRVAREVGTEGKLGGQARVEGAAGTWKELTDNVNTMATNLTDQVRGIAVVTSAVAAGDLSQKITIQTSGEVQVLTNTINKMVDQLNVFAAEVTRVAREVGTEGKLGGQARVEGVAGTWKELTDNVNTMATNLTNQVRGIAVVMTEVANGNLRRRLTLQAPGEIGDLSVTINDMIDTLDTFSDEVTKVAREVGVEGRLGGQADVPTATGTWRTVTDNVNLLANNLTQQVRAIGDVAASVTAGDFSKSIDVETKGEMDELSRNLNRMITTLKNTTRANDGQNWLSSNLARLNGVLQGQRDLSVVADVVFSEMASLMDVKHGILYLKESERGDALMRLFASYAYNERTNLANEFRTREGLVGQCLADKKMILLTNVPSDYVHISSGLGEAPPLNVVVHPILFEDQILAVIELATFTPFSDIQLEFLDQFSDAIGIVINALQTTNQTRILLQESQVKTERLQASELELQAQQKELRRTNEELEQQAEEMIEQHKRVEGKNMEIEEARMGLLQKAEQLEMTSKYKSEFLANMSHELRTPLNSLLILADLLAADEEGNLTEKQLESVKTILGSGTDLILLINEILDLAKIESGTMGIEVEEVVLTDIRDYLDQTFLQVSEKKGLSFTMELAPNLPKSITTDRNRVQQLLGNLLSNAFKFTDRGSIFTKIEIATEGWNPDHEALSMAEVVLGFSVTDTGIGIPENMQAVIFESFQQAEGSDKRKYGGTGLGLAICREIARLLGGEVRLVRNVPGEGCTFTLFLPENYPGEQNLGPDAHESSARNPSGLLSSAVVGSRPIVSPELPLSSEVPMLPDGTEDDRATIQEGDHVLLVIEDDPIFAPILRDMARERELKVIIAMEGSGVLPLIHRYKPVAITLDIRLPGLSGWAILDRLKRDPTTRHIPIHIITVEADRVRGLELGAVSYREKPTNRKDLMEIFEGIQTFNARKVKNLLVVENDEVGRQVIIDLIGTEDNLNIDSAGSGEEALTALQENSFDCLVTDLGLPDISGIDLIKRIHNDLGLKELPIIVYTGKELTQKENLDLSRMTEAIIVKGINSPERLLAETALFLHRVESTLPESKRQMIKKSNMTDPVLSDKKVLVVDDDMRNIFAITSLLERYKLQIIHAEDGLEGIQALETNPDVDIVLMDIMMPRMDGYEAMGRIRKIDRYKELPIIALTAKAMKEDRDKCIIAGASDYVSKPVDTEQLISLLRVWLYKQ